MFLLGYAEENWNFWPESDIQDKIVNDSAGGISDMPCAQVTMPYKEAVFLCNSSAAQPKVSHGFYALDEFWLDNATDPRYALVNRGAKQLEIADVREKARWIAKRLRRAGLTYREVPGLAEKEKADLKADLVRPRERE